MTIFDSLLFCNYCHGFFVLLRIFSYILKSQLPKDKVTPEIPLVNGNDDHKQTTHLSTSGDVPGSGSVEARLGPLPGAGGGDVEHDHLEFGWPTT